MFDLAARESACLGFLALGVVGADNNSTNDNPHDIQEHEPHARSDLAGIIVADGYALGERVFCSQSSAMKNGTLFPSVGCSTVDTEKDHVYKPLASMHSCHTSPDSQAQRHAIEYLQAWQNLGLGMFLHYGMSTFVENELPSGNDAPTTYAPAYVDVDQWVSIARDSGMKYAILTAKHVAGHCLWPSRHTDYHVGAGGGDRSDVVGKFVEACRAKGVLPGLYYCLWDNHHRFGSVTPSDVAHWQKSTLLSSNNDSNPEHILRQAFTTSEANEFFLAQLTELASDYGEIFEFWVDIPGVVGRDFRNKIYTELARLQPQSLIMMNSGFGDGTKYPVHYAWPSDLMAIERWLPNSTAPYNPWREIEGRHYYVPGEVCDPIGREWFFTEADQPRSPREILGMYLVCRERNTNLLLDVGPDRNSRIPQKYENALNGFRALVEKIDI